MHPSVTVPLHFLISAVVYGQTVQMGPASLKVCHRSKCHPLDTQDSCVLTVPKCTDYSCVQRCVYISQYYIQHRCFVSEYNTVHHNDRTYCHLGSVSLRKAILFVIIYSIWCAVNEVCLVFSFPALLPVRSAAQTPLSLTCLLTRAPCSMRGGSSA